MIRGRLFFTILLTFTGLGFSTSSYAFIDSIGTEVIEGKRYILHKVEKSEGLFGIARKYGSQAGIIQEVNNLSTTSLEIGQILKVPAKAIVSTEKKKTVTTEPTATKTVVKEKEIVTNPKIDQKSFITHTVKKSETLYLLSRKYNMSVSEIIRHNNLKNNSLSIGKKLKIPKKGATIDDDHQPETPNNTKINTEPQKDIANGKASRNNSYMNSVDYDETGVAGWINDKSFNPKKSIALHKTAPIGTIVRVTNLMNNKSVYVKVIGALPETGDNENTVIILSKAAVQMLGAVDQKFRVNLSYSIPKE